MRKPIGKPGAAVDPYLAGPVKNTLRKETGAMQKFSETRLPV